MAKYFLFLALAIPVILVACGGDDNNIRSESPSQSVGYDQITVPGDKVNADFFKGVGEDFAEEPSAVGAPASTEPSFYGAASSSEDGEIAASSSLQGTERPVISTASISLEVEMVKETIATVRTIAEGLGGFVERLSSSGNEDHQQASITIRVPQAQFFDALDKLSDLGAVWNQNIGSDDVGEQFIDLEARLNSSLREEKSLLSLLDKVEGLSEVLIIERELNRIRSEIERFQGQLNFLQRRVDLATISVSLFSTGADQGEPPSAALVIELPNVARTVGDIKTLISSLGGELDQVFITVQNGKESAQVILRVFRGDFEGSLASIEEMGDVTSKRVQEGALSKDGDIEALDEPDARMQLTLVEGEGSNTGTIMIIAASLGSIGFLGLIALLFTLVYRAGRSRPASPL